MSLSEREQALCTIISGRASSLIKDLAAHVAIPTGTGYATGIDEYRGLLLERLTALGATVTTVAGSQRPDWLRLPHARSVADEAAPPTVLAAQAPPDGTAPAILLAGHLDTVHDPEGDFRELIVAPGGVTATGPGAADMKGGILIAIAALESLAEAGHHPGWTFLLNADEEIGSFHSAEALRGAAATHRVGIALEPALPDGSLVVERMGTGMFRVEVHGRSAHVGREFARGISAVYRLAHVLNDLESMVDLERGRIVNVGPLEGGTVVNVVPDHAVLWGNARFRDEVTQKELERDIRGLATAGEILPRVEVKTIFNRPAKPLTDAVRGLAGKARAVAEDLGQEMPFASTGGVCDGNILQQAGLPTIDTLGVRGGNLHRTDEYVEIASLVERCQLLAVLLLRLDEELRGG